MPRAEAGKGAGLMRRIVSVLLGVPAFILLAAFALANRGWVRVSFDPLAPEAPLFSVTVPLWTVFFAGIFVGLVAGGVATWLKQGKWRKRARQGIYELEEERQRAARLERKLKEAAAPPALPGAGRDAA